MGTDFDIWHLGDVPQDFHTNARMLLDGLVFLIRQLGVLIQDIVGNTNFSDIVQKCHEVNLVLVLNRLARSECNFLAVFCDAAGMTVGVTVLGIDRRGKSLHDLQRKNFVFPLAFFKFRRSALHFAFQRRLQLA